MLVICVVTLIASLYLMGCDFCGTEKNCRGIQAHGKINFNLTPLKPMLELKVLLLSKKQYMRLLFFVLLLAGQQMTATEFYWGKTGHRVVGELAEQNIKRSTLRKIDKLLDGQSLALVANFGDDIKSDPRFREFGPWHYVNIEPGKKYGDDTPSKRGDIVSGIQKCIAVVQDENASKEDRAFFLKLLVHFMGDLHQPMHVGYPEDRGGNDIQLRWFNKGTNLHRLWDTDMIEFYDMSFTELSENLPVLDKKEKERITQGELLDWVADSQLVAKQVYQSVEVGEKLGYSYMYEHFDTVKIQLQKAGLRLAKLLDEIL